MTRPRSTACLIAALVPFALASAADEGKPPSLRFDPFRPLPKADVTTGRARGANVERGFEPVLRSTVVGGERPVVNLGGEILAIGEESHGYRLLSVGVFHAVFSRNGERLRLEVETGGERDR